MRKITQLLKILYLFLHRYYKHFYKYDYEKYSSLSFLRRKESDRFESIAPYVIYCFWTGDNEMSENRKKGIESMKKNCGVTIQLITNKTLKDFILPNHPLHKSFKYLSLVHKSDYLRCYFMHHYGGGYSDIKPHINNWKKSFDLLNNKKNKIAIGYGEIDTDGVGYISDFFSKEEVLDINNDMKKHFKYLIGNCSYIFKPQTEFTQNWIDEVHKRLDFFYEELKKHPGNIMGDNEGYPLPWTSILGQIFHPLCLKFHENLLINNDLKPILKNYR